LALVAVYSLKGGVGKTTLAVNLGWAAARLSGRRTLLWDLDSQAASTFLIGPLPDPVAPVRAVLAFDIGMDAIVPTDIPMLDILPADASLRALESLLSGGYRGGGLRRLIAQVEQHYDLVILDCPPGYSTAVDEAMRSASLILVPTMPSLLSQRMLIELSAYIRRQHQETKLIVPVFTKVDRRLPMHRAVLALEPDRPVIPLAGVVERMATRHSAVGEFAPASRAARAFSELWEGLERQLY
jgi:cellulose biosynthesis protein BcsQ